MTDWMQIRMRGAGPALTENDLRQLESRLGSDLPGSYREFLLRFNGGRPTPSHFDVPNWPVRESLVNDFNGVVPGAYNDLEKDLDLLQDRIPKDLIPIADDPGGNVILLGVGGPYHDHVFFWDHDNEPFDAGESLEEYPNVYPIAQDFRSFLMGLRDNERTSCS